MIHLEHRVKIQAPADRVWAAITNWTAQGEWMFATSVTDSGVPGVGQHIEAFTGFGPVGFLDTMTVTKWEPPRRCEVDHTGKVVRGTGAFEVIPINDHACELVWEEDLIIPLGAIGAAGFAVIKPAFMAGIRHSLNRFASQVELA